MRGYVWQGRSQKLLSGNGILFGCIIKEKESQIHFCICCRSRIPRLVPNRTDFFLNRVSIESRVRFTTFFFTSILKYISPSESEIKVPPMCPLETKRRREVPLYPRKLGSFRFLIAHNSETIAGPSISPRNNLLQFDQRIQYMWKKVLTATGLNRFVCASVYVTFSICFARYLRAKQYSTELYRSSEG